MDELKLGQLITVPRQRDAIHIAVAPMISGATLRPGQHVGIGESGHAVPLAENLIGVVDPYLMKPVKVGEKFWLFLYPNTITSLRHEWAHPSFSADGIAVQTESERWLRDFATQVDADYGEMMYIAGTHCEGSSREWADYLIQGGKWEGEVTPGEFWDHYKNVTGKSPAEGQRPGIFSCSC
jgi:hypothetical protein